MNTTIKGSFKCHMWFRHSLLRLGLAGLCLMGSGGTCLHAQNHRIFSSSIASLSVMAGDDWMGLPVATLGGEKINIGFDELSHEYHRFTYRIEHMEADWTPSEGLFPSDFIDGFADDNTIDDYEESVSTYQLFTHYRLSIPNEHIRLTMSGNYRLTVMDANDDDRPVLSVCFMLSENSAGLRFQVLTNTDKDINGRHQQIAMEASYGSLDVSDPRRQLQTVVLQNQRWDNAVRNAQAQYLMQDGMRWEHSRELVFLAGTDYHKFEMLDPTHTTLGLESVGWDEANSQWNAYVQPDSPLLHYTHDESACGSFLIRNSDNYENDLMSDYIMTHFELHAPQQPGKVFISGVWTRGELSPFYEMQWNAETGVYENAILLKQGYYSYRYLLLDDNGTLSNIIPEGNFFETRNRYDVLLYYRSPADRATRLVAHAHN